MDSMEWRFGWPNREPVGSNISFNLLMTAILEVFLLEVVLFQFIWGFVRF